MRLPAGPRPVALRHHAELHAPVAGARLLSVSTGPDGAAVCAWSSPASDARRATLTTQGPDPVSQVEVSGVLPAQPTVQPLPQGGFVWVGARASWTPDRVESNALVFDAQGAQTDARCVGDGINHARTTAGGDLWLAFSDQGIFGNMGWGRPGPEPLGRAGLVRRGPDLDVRWEYDRESAPGLVADCSVLNVADGVVWSYHDTDGPIIRIDGGRVTAWVTTTDGTRALVTDGTTVALVGGYGRRSHRVVAGRLADGFVPSSTARLTLPDGRRVPTEATVDARGDQLHVFAHKHWFRADLRGLVDPRGRP